MSFICTRKNSGKSGEEAGPVGESPIKPFPLLLLALLTVACLLPFINRAFNMDEPLFIWSAQHIQNDPLNFYGFQVNWEGREAAMASVNQNPPLAAYYLALIGSFFGWSEAALHLGFLLPALALVLGTYFLARSLGADALAAGLVVIATPVFLLSSASVMCDTMMVALWTWSVVFWIEGLKRESPTRLLVSAILITLCCLTKYFGMSLIPLLLVYSAIERRRIGHWLYFLLLPALLLGIYQWLTHKLYGRGLLLDAAAYATTNRVGGDWPSKILSGLAFGGGGLIVLLPAAPRLWGKRTLLAGMATAVAAGGLLVGMKQFGTFPVVEDGRVHGWFLVQAAVLVTTGASILALAAADVRKRNDSASVLL